VFFVDKLVKDMVVECRKHVEFVLSRSSENYVIREAKQKLKEYLLTPPRLKATETLPGLTID
jgi:hypothetical protein